MKQRYYVLCGEVNLVCPRMYPCVVCSATMCQKCAFEQRSFPISNVVSLETVAACGNECRTTLSERSLSFGESADEVTCHVCHLVIGADVSSGDDDCLKCVVVQYVVCEEVIHESCILDGEASIRANKLPPRVCGMECYAKHLKGDVACRLLVTLPCFTDPSRLALWKTCVSILAMRESHDVCGCL